MIQIMNFLRSFIKYGVALTIDGLELENYNAIYSEPQKLNENYTSYLLINLLLRIIMVLKDSSIIYRIKMRIPLINESFIFINHRRHYYLLY